MRVLFDNCTSPVMARTLDGFIRSDGHSAVHIRDLPLSHPTDLEWIGYLRNSNEEWIVVTGDMRLHRNAAERAAFRQARLKGVVLAAAYQKSPSHKVCAVMIHQWPALIETLSRFDPPFLVEMSINFSGRFKQLSL
jgi:predicted nuclease of predicted toxin-antitoxin system